MRRSTALEAGHLVVSERARVPRFLADSMLEGLARWLRLLGFDAASDSRLSDGAMVQCGRRESRTLLTRDRHLERHAEGVPVFRIRAERTLDQLREVIDAFQLRDAIRLLTRCNRCNRELVALPDERDRSGGLEPTEARMHCPSCGRCYFEGSHTRRIRAALHRVLRMEPGP